MRHKWIVHKGKRIYYGDLSDLKSDIKTLRVEIEAGDSLVTQEPENSVLVLIDVRNTTISSESMTIFKESAVKTKKYARKTAVIGATMGFKTVLLNAVVRFSNRPMVAFDNIEKAKDWLVEETGKGDPESRA